METECCGNSFGFRQHKTALSIFCTAHSRQFQVKEVFRRKKKKNAKMQSKNYSINGILKKHGAHAPFNLTLRKEEV